MDPPSFLTSQHLKPLGRSRYVVVRPPRDSLLIFKFLQENLPPGHAGTPLNVASDATAVSMGSGESGYHPVYVWLSSNQPFLA